MLYCKVLCCFLMFLLPSAGTAALYTASSSAEIQTRTNMLVAGDTLLVQAGTYNLTSWSFTSRSGSADKWIIVQSVGNVTINGISTSANVVQFRDCHFIRFSGFSITASVIQGPTALKIIGNFNSNLLFENLLMHDIPYAGVEIFPDSAAFITFRKCEIARVGGSGMYIGYPGRNIVHDIVVDSCYIHHCPLDSTSSTNYGIQFKGGSWRAKITNNVLHDVGGTSRSAICVYYGKNSISRDDTSDMNIVGGNVVWNSRNEGITVMSDALVQNNIVFDASTGIHLQSYNDETYTGRNLIENLIVRNNTVYRCRNACLQFTTWTSDIVGTNIHMSGNLFYQPNLGAAAIRQSSVAALDIFSGNYYYGTNSFSSSVDGFVLGNGDADFISAGSEVSIPQIDFYPASSAPFVQPGDSLKQFADHDFEGRSRPFGLEADAGAYEYYGSNVVNWKINSTFKGDTAETIVAEKQISRMLPFLSAQPNPFRSVVKISLDKHLSGKTGNIIQVVDMAGRTVRELVSDGTYAEWDGKDKFGLALSSGVYMLVARRDYDKKLVLRIFLSR